MVCKIGFTTWNAKVALLHASMVVTYYIKLFRKGADRHNGILMSLLLVVETIKANFLEGESPLLPYGMVCFLLGFNRQSSLKRNKNQCNYPLF